MRLDREATCSGGVFDVIGKLLIIYASCVIFTFIAVFVLWWLS